MLLYISARTRELPDNYPFVVQWNYIKGFTQKWSPPAMILFDEVYEILRADLGKLVEVHFAHMGNGNGKQAILWVTSSLFLPSMLTIGIG
jgi:hypothetical protein